jgi:hypothetical protein
MEDVRKIKKERDKLRNKKACCWIFAHKALAIQTFRMLSPVDW